MLMHQRVTERALRRFEGDTPAGVDRDKRLSHAAQPRRWTTRRVCFTTWG